ncbi:tripartite tricarboxylate transporter TctB family protein [Kushneria indalinina]|uniref:Tripartite tricarboxylate transporter TctB family protein n=1 Tax=Kushneria indalinina DSM 14324 TaxID=1122140 RepID=A0A3D9DUC5_9GAMM|nr:tripartite tricarboxylate transporter TctB family protein [Kushneria indalinina]REC94378.1 tripartite tricarboxylate transporter TctB family protein [Kushneria indalinina DSM 14324]
MKMRSLKALAPVDWISALVMIVLGLAVVVGALDYRLGTAGRMGPGFYPMLLGGLMVLLGMGVALRALFGKAADSTSEDKAADDAREEAANSRRSLICVPLSIALFGLLLQPAGLIPACLALVIVSTLAAPTFSIKRLVALCIGVPLLVVLIFVVGLGLPFTLIRGVW